MCANPLLTFILSYFFPPDSIEELDISIMQKKMKIPKMTTRNSGHAIDNHFSEERVPLRHKKVQ